MRKEFVECRTQADAKKLCPWAGFFLKVEGGYWCFESRSDYEVARKQK